MERRKTRQVFVGDVPLGGDAPIVIQSMLNAPQGDIEANILQARELSAAGCQLIRLSVTNMEDIETVKALKEHIRVPIIADIQMNYKLALASIEAGIDKIRINPRYIGGEDKIRLVADACKAHKVPIRVGVNSGSVELDLLEKYGGVTPEAMAESAMRGVKYLEDVDFHDIVISIKSSDIRTMIAAYRIVAAQCDYPLHLGVTEAGTERMGRVKSSIGIGALLADGIGDTMRVSLTDDPVKEIDAANDILRALDLLPDAPQLVACPTCGRTQIDLIGLAEKAEKLVAAYDDLDLTVAVMGCVVNGPGEAKEADFGIAGGKGTGLLIRKGEVVRTLPEEELLPALKEELERARREKQ